MPRRFHTSSLSVGEVALDPSQSRHARDVLRLTPDTAVELFDDAGRTAAGVIVTVDGAVVVRVSAVAEAPPAGLRVVVASAVPKANRADWMVEKLSELGVDTFVPLATARSVVLPEGRGKLDRWVRLSAESAKQSRRAGVMTIEPLAAVDEVLRHLVGGPAWCLSTEAGTVPIGTALASLGGARSLTLFVGPEGGWTDAERAAFVGAGVVAVRMGATVLRVETAALAAASIVVAMARTMPPE